MLGSRERHIVKRSACSIPVFAELNGQIVCEFPLGKANTLSYADAGTVSGSCETRL